MKWFPHSFFLFHRRSYLIRPPPIFLWGLSLTLNTPAPAPKPSSTVRHPFWGWKVLPCGSIGGFDFLTLELIEIKKKALPSQRVSRCQWSVACSIFGWFRFRIPLSCCKNHKIVFHREAERMEHRARGRGSRSPKGMREQCVPSSFTTSHAYVYCVVRSSSEGSCSYMCYNRWGAYIIIMPS